MDAIYNAARSRNNARRAKVRVSLYTTKPVDSDGNPAVASGRYVCAIARFAPLSYQEGRSMRRLAKHLGISIRVIRQGEDGSVIDAEVAAAVGGRALVEFLRSKYVASWHLKAMIRVAGCAGSGPEASPRKMQRARMSERNADQRDYTTAPGLDRPIWS